MFAKASYFGIVSLCALAAITSAAAQRPDASSPATGAFNITPLRLELSSSEQSTQMLVRNEASRTMAVQVRLFEWVQVDGKDVYRPSRDHAISPSIVKIEPDRTQTFHIVSGSKKAGGEARYRVVIDQLPDQNKAAAGMAQTRLRMTIPLFVGSDRARPADMSFRIENGQLLLTNNGGRTARLSRMKANLPGGLEKVVATSGPKYVMGGSTIRVELPEEFRCSADTITISGIVDKKSFNATPSQHCS